MLKYREDNVNQVFVKVTNHETGYISNKFLRRFINTILRHLYFIHKLSMHVKYSYIKCLFLLVKSSEKSVKSGMKSKDFKIRTPFSGVGDPS